MNYSMKPFGEVSFEQEKKALGSDWSDYFFEYARFISDALERETYLIVGRRGSGKSSLAEYFKYQHKYNNAQCICVSKAESYSTEMYEIAQNLRYSAELAIQNLVSVWSLTIWQLIFRELASYDEAIAKGVIRNRSGLSASGFVRLFLKGVLEKHVTTTGAQLVDSIVEHFEEERFSVARQAALERARRRPIIVVIDSREQYAVDNDFEMWITAALVQCASVFNVDSSHYGLHVKVCVSDEVFPHLKEHHITNTLKYVRSPLFLHWRPKDLIRLICWRFFKYLKAEKLTRMKEQDVNWDNFQDVHEKMWIPYFGDELENLQGLKEKTLPYILRHTHLRPRQLVILCNMIARTAKRRGTFPHFEPSTIKDAIHETEIDLADELINSYHGIFPQIGHIVAALEGMPMEFKGRDLDKIAPRTASHWPKGNYSPLGFRQLLAELGIIGRKRGEIDDRTRIVEADFEFAMRDRLFIHESDVCVIHPMFYSKLNINTRKLGQMCVYPFPDKPAFRMFRGVS